VTSLLADWRLSDSRHRDWVVSSVRPVTLLIASGIVLIAAILILTGIVAGRLRDQTVVATEAELARFDAVLAQSGGRTFHVGDSELQVLSERLSQGGALGAEAFAGAAAAPEATTTLEAGLGVASPFAAIALIGPDGALLNTAGWWPPSAVDFAKRDFYSALRAQAGGDRSIGAPITDPRTGARLIPLARRIVDRANQTLGYIVGVIPAADFETFYGSVPLGAGGGVSLVRRDGTVLAQYPAQSGPAGTKMTAMLPGSASGTGTGKVRDRADGGAWRIEAYREISGFPLSIVVTRNGEAALDEWSHQAMLLGALAVLGAFGVAVMVFLIARQFRVHAALASVRAEKIESEHARLLTEAELLKKERLSVLGQLTATVAHELRNPLSAIRNTLFSVKELANNSGLKLDRPIGRMERSIERCNRIIGDLLEYARTRELRRSTVDIESWLKEVLAEQSVPAAVSLEEDFRAPDAAVSIDGERVRRVVINLIDNAAQALAEMPPDSGERRITVHTGVVDDVVVLTVEDTGPGIPPENRARIFEPLFSTKSFGTGLGLATVKQIVGQHGGTIDVDSEVGRGTSVTIRLPRETAKVAA
jgi:signal transduction histidine kinase